MPVLDDIDRFQRCHRWLAFPVAVYAKFSDDQAANLASLLAYYAFFSIFPLLLRWPPSWDSSCTATPTWRPKCSTAPWVCSRSSASTTRCTP